MSHPFGDLVSQHLHRKHGLSQSKLAEGILQAPTIISGMCKGRRLTGPQARERVVAIIQWLHQQSALTTLAEANALLNAAGMAGLQTNQPAEATLLRLLPNSPVSEENRVASAPTGSMDSRRTMTNAFLKAPPGQPSAVPESQIQSLPAKEPKSKTSHHNLPVQLTPFVGRTSEMSKVATLLADPAVRLLTLLGPGGIGKTRLALEVATRQLDHFTDGVYFVSLASVDSGYSLIPLIANALGFSFHSDASPHRQLGDYLQEKNVLLVLDNCEHLIDTTVSPHPAAVTAAMPSFLLLLELLQAAPKLKILLTSRAHINVQGEQLYALDGIDFPQADLPTLPVALQSSAVTLFVQSARMAQPDFQLTEQNVAAVVQICQLVQGLPLAILLAAAWLPMLTPAEILAELRKSQATTPSLDFLAADLHDMPARHRSLRAVFDHSWRLLTAEEQTIFAQLAVFRSGFTLQAAEEILDFRFWRLPAQALDSAPSTPTIQNQKPKIQHILRTLLNKSLIRRRPDQQEQGRYDLHELVRQYAAERLAQMADQGEGVRERHSRFYCELLGAQEARMHGAERKVALAAIELDLGNIRTAWRWALEHPQVAHLSRAVRCLGYFYEARHRYQEAEAAYSSAVRHLEIIPQPSQRLQLELAKALAWYGVFCRLLGRWGESEECLRRSLRILEGADLPAQMQQTVSAFIFLQLGRLFDTQANHAEGKRCYQQALAYYEAIGETWGQAHAHVGLGILAYRTVAYAEARQHYEASLALYQQLDDDNGSAGVLAHLGYIYRDQGDFATAQRLTAESITLYERLADRAAIAHGQLALSWLYLYMGRFHEAYAMFEQANLVFTELRLPSPFMALKVMLAVANLELGRYDLAHEQLQVYLDESHNMRQRHEIAFGYLLLSLLATIEQRYEAAEQMALDARAYFEELNDLDRLALAIAAQGFAAHGLGKADVTRECFVAALQSAVAHHGFISITFALAGIALVLAAQGQVERAVDLYAQLNQLPLVANSRLRWDLASAHLAAVADTLPPDAVAAAYARAPTTDLWATAAALVSELVG